jgi:hypothetical protein
MNSRGSCGSGQCRAGSKAGDNNIIKVGFTRDFDPRESFGLDPSPAPLSSFGRSGR